MPRPCTARVSLRDSQAATAPKRSDLDALNAWLQTTHEEPTAVGVTVFTRPESGGSIGALDPANSAVLAIEIDAGLQVRAIVAERRETPDGPILLLELT
jgi:hypothetical protein